MQIKKMRTKQKLRKMTSSSNLRPGSICMHTLGIHKLFEMINQQFKIQETRYQVLPNFQVCCREQGGPKVTSFAHVCAVSALSKMNSFFDEAT